MLPGTGWSILTTDNTGDRPANCNTGVSGKPLYLAYRRETETKKEFLKKRTRIIDLVIINKSKSEKVPYGYVSLKKSFNSTCWRGGQALYLCVLKSPRSEGLMEKSYRPVVLDSYFGYHKKDRETSSKTQQNQKKENLLNHLPMFGFPRGVRLIASGKNVIEEQEENETDDLRTTVQLEKSNSNGVPLPRLSRFVLTNEENTTLYGTRLVYYESVPLITALPQLLLPNDDHINAQNETKQKNTFSTPLKQSSTESTESNTLPVIPTKPTTPRPSTPPLITVPLPPTSPRKRNDSTYGYGGTI